MAYFYSKRWAHLSLNELNLPKTAPSSIQWWHKRKVDAESETAAQRSNVFFLVWKFRFLLKYSSVVDCACPFYQLVTMNTHANINWAVVCKIAVKSKTDVSVRHKSYSSSWENNIKPMCECDLNFSWSLREVSWSTTLKQNQKLNFYSWVMFETAHYRAWVCSPQYRQHCVS